ncbi:MAG: uracil phosphoribosyltransferase, partial [Desulfonatronovibrio sp.]
MAVHVVDHPLVKHKLGIMRKKDVDTYNFRALCQELTRFLVYEATKSLEMESRTVQGWAGDVKVESIKGKKITLVPILRAGPGMLDGSFDL